MFYSNILKFESKKNVEFQSDMFLNIYILE